MPAPQPRLRVATMAEQGGSSLQMVHRTFCGRSALFAAAEPFWSISEAN